MQKITPFLWFNGNIAEAMDFYTRIFKDASITNISKMGDGSVRSASFQLEGQHFHAFNGGPQFNFTPAISFFVNCETQEEVDELWGKLTAGGEESRCGWLKDKFGLSWQIIPSQLGKLLNAPDPKKAKNVLNAMLKMSKINIQVLQAAYDQE
jgi:predicted 3-demethylubiquinone-9 3-methyltransferase (glyoxalase superfamily)